MEMKIIKNEVPLTTEFLPDRITGRENEINLINKLMFASDAQITVLIKGRPGTGKTLLAKFLMKMHPEFNGKYVNCYVSNSDRLILSEIGGKDYWRGGDFQSSSIENIVKQIFQKENRKNLIVLDEVHSLKSSNNKIIYILTRSTELGLPPVKLMLLSIEDPEMFFDKNVLSSINKINQVVLKSYDATQLFEILKSRAELALYEGTYDNEALMKIAELSEASGNARFAIELLRYSAKLAELRDKVLSSDIVLESSKDYIEPIDDSALKYLDEWEVDILINFLNNLNSNRFTTEEIRSIIPGLTEAKMYKWLRDLESSGIINKRKLSSGYGGGVRNEFSLNVQKDYLLNTLYNLKR
jgi:Cdc6-related protein, AAA superfamily ATPase